jgi:uncharacterized protein YdcH (DUF465 family)
MNHHLEELRKRHRRLNRLIDSCKSAGREHEMKRLKRIRLKLKDAISDMLRRLEPSPI